MMLVAYDKQPMPLCMAICKIARERGLGELGIWDHTLTQKTRQVPSDNEFCGVGFYWLSVFFWQTHFNIFDVKFVGK